MPSPSSAGSPATLSDRLDAIYDLIHRDQPADAELVWLLSPDEECDQVELTWLPAGKVMIDPFGDIEAGVVSALRQLADEIREAADRIEEGSR